MPSILASSLIVEIFERFAHLNPDPEGELRYLNHFTLLVAIVLSAQATDKSVNKVTPALFDKADTAEKMIDLGEDALKDYIKSIGLFRTKAKNIIALSKILYTQYGGEVPCSFDELIKLPGVGRKTANVFLNAGCDEATIPVDTHVGRVARRLDLSDQKTPHGIEKDLLAVIPSDYLKRAHIWLVLHGRYICQARRPLCAQCPLNDLCPSRVKS